MQEIATATFSNLAIHMAAEGHSLKSVARYLSLVACVLSLRGEKKEACKQSL